MNDWKRVSKLLEDPRTGKTPELNDGQLDFPHVDGIPLFYRDPDAQRALWQGNIVHYLQTLDREVALLQQELKAPNLLDGSRKRLELLKSSKQENRKLAAELLRPFLSSVQGKVELNAALKNKIPMSQKILSYYSNLFRDWNWGDEENEISLEEVEKALPKSFDTMAVLGSGASRLAYDIHQKRDLLTVALDISPILLLAANKIIRGESVRLFEFPAAPINLAGNAVERELKAPAPAKEGFYLLFADAMNPPLEDGAFDLILAPWFIDIIPQNFFSYLVKVNQKLKMGGTFVHFGTLAFFHPKRSVCFSPEEIETVAGLCGFKITYKNSKRIPYLHSPISGNHRNENVFTISFEKVEDFASESPYHYLPEELTKTDIPFQPTRAISEVLKTNQVYATVLSAIDGKKSLKQIAQQVAKKYNSDPDQTLATIQTFLAEVFDNHSSTYR